MMRGFDSGPLRSVFQADIHAPQLLKEVADAHDLAPGQTTEDGLVSLLTARCVGSCGLAPVAVFDGEVEGNMTPEKLRKRLQKWSEDDERTITILSIRGTR